MWESRWPIGLRRDVREMDEARSAPIGSSPTPSRKKPRLTLNACETQYPVVRWVARKVFNWKLSTDPEDTDFDVWWCDGSVQPEKLSHMHPYQKINHFPGMAALARKNQLAKNLGRMKKAFAEDYDFFPPTWVLPTDFGDLRAFATKYPRATFIVKPEALSQGKGIFLTRNIDDLGEGARYVVQKYLDRPLLLEGLKFDLRIYALVAGCDPLRIFLFEEGLARLATEEYVAPNSANLADVCMHLTNYAVNKFNPNFVFNEDEADDDVGHKRSLTAAFKLLRGLGVDTDKLRKEIADIVVKTLCAVQPSLAHLYKTCQPEDRANACCFEILGFDILLDEYAKPWLLEVNHSPSFTTDTPLDKKVKRQLIADTLTLLDVHPKYKKRYLARRKNEIEKRTLGKAQKETRVEREALCSKAKRLRDKWEDAHLGGFTRIYPSEDNNYQEFLKAARLHWQEWTGVPSDELIQSKLGQRIVKAPAFSPPPVVALPKGHKRSLSASEGEEEPVKVERAAPSVFERLSQTNEKQLPLKLLPSLYPDPERSENAPIRPVQPGPIFSSLPAHILARFAKGRQASVQPPERNRTHVTVEMLMREQFYSRTMHVASLEKPGPTTLHQAASPNNWVSPFASPRGHALQLRRPRIIRRI